MRRSHHNLAAFVDLEQDRQAVRSWQMMHVAELDHNLLTRSEGALSRNHFEQLMLLNTHLVQLLFTEKERGQEAEGGYTRVD